MTESINGLILTGGQSSRMGTDKGLIRYREKPQREYLFDLLLPFCKQVYTSCKPGTSIPKEFNPMPDKFDFQSPLNGLLTAFLADPASAWLSVPVDMPFVDKDLIQYLIQHRNPTKMAACFWNSDRNLPEPLLTIWEPEAKKLLFDYYDHGGLSPLDFLKKQDIQVVHPQSPKSLINVNSPSDLKHFSNLT